MDRYGYLVVTDCMRGYDNHCLYFTEISHHGHSHLVFRPVMHIIMDQQGFALNYSLYVEHLTRYRFNWQFKTFDLTRPGI